jgi:hypothetical protein
MGTLESKGSGGPKNDNDLEFKCLVESICLSYYMKEQPNLSVSSGMLVRRSKLGGLLGKLCS